MADPLKTLLVHHNPEAASALKAALATTADLEVAGDAGLGPVALTWARTLAPDLVLVMADEPYARPLATIELLSRGQPHWTIVALVTQFDQDVFRKAVLAGVADVLVRTTPAADLRSALLHARRVDQGRRAEVTPGTEVPAGTVISVVGVKGGIGKTTIATNLAASLARETASSVALVDLDLPFGDVALMLDLHPERDVTTALNEDVLNDPDRLQAHMVPGPEGIQVLSAPLSTRLNGLSDGQVNGQQVARLLSRLASLYDFVLVDTPPGVSELTAAAIDGSALALLVTTPEVPCLHRTRAFLDMMRSLDYPMERVQLVLNRASSKTGVKDGESEEVLRAPISWRVANDFAAMKGAALGQPVVVAQPRADLSQSIRAIARQLGGLPADKRHGWRAWLPHAAIPMIS